MTADSMNLEERDRLLTPRVLEFIHKSLGATPESLGNIVPTKAGMTNRSFRFRWQQEDYILRVPGEGTHKLISRPQEAAAYAALQGDPISDQVLALDPDTGCKLTRFWPNTHNCDPSDWTQVARCMTLLRDFHRKGYQVGHTFDLYGEITRYETLMGGRSRHPDYPQVRARCFALKPYLDNLEKPWCLSHIDSVPDNFLFVGEEIHLIDWEYAGMQDPHLDVAMFAIYAGYDRSQLERLMALYLGQPCPDDLKKKLYSYVALGGLLWSNWCEYKQSLGVSFGDYAQIQYRYAGEYSLLAAEYQGGEGP